MNNQKLKWKIFAVLMVMFFMGGCIPEDTLEWSEDGSVGLMEVQGALYLVDGQSGDITNIEEDNVQHWPDISKDGKWVVYSKEVECANLSDGLKQLPAGQVKMIEYYANQMKEQITENDGLVNGDFPFPKQGLLTPHNYRNWVIRYVCEKYIEDISKILGADEIQKGRQKEIVYYQITVVNRDELSKKKIIATSIFNVSATKFSPNAKLIAYLMHTQQGQVDNAFQEYSLYIASIEGNISAMFIDHPVAVGFSWRNDSKAVSYWKADAKDLRYDEPLFGTLKEKIVADANDNLFVKPAVEIKQGTIETHWCTKGFRQIAGTIFYPWMKAVYGLDGRIFFSSVSLTLPSGSLDEAKWSLFCYDPVTESITDILPSSISDYVGQTINCFAISSDERRLLLPVEKNRFAIYTLGSVAADIPIKAEEGFGEENALYLAPAWKGKDEISCLVSEESHFLVKEGEEKHNRNEIVIIGVDSKFRQKLSDKWPDKVINSF